LKKDISQEDLFEKVVQLARTGKLDLH
jgi:hypothetical protein